MWLVRGNLCTHPQQQILWPAVARTRCEERQRSSDPQGQAH
jgi:hypothetical protein